MGETVADDCGATMISPKCRLSRIQHFRGCYLNDTLVS